MSGRDAPSDEELVRRCLDGSERAASRLVGRHHRALVRHLSRKTGDRDRARDLAQRAWMRAWRHLHRFDSERASFSGWLRMIANRMATNAARDRKRRPEELFQRHREAREGEGPDRPLQWKDTSRAPDRLFRRRQLREEIRDAVEKLSPSLRATYRLRLLGDLPFREIADRIGIPAGTVKSRVYRGRKQVRATLTAAVGETP